MLRDLHGPDTNSPFARGGRFHVVIVLDRSGVDAQCRRAARMRVAVVVSAGLVLGCLAAVWLATLRLMESKSRA